MEQIEVKDIRKGERIRVEHPAIRPCAIEYVACKNGDQFYDYWATNIDGMTWFVIERVPLTLPDKPTLGWLTDARGETHLGFFQQDGSHASEHSTRGAKINTWYDPKGWTEATAVAADEY